MSKEELEKLDKTGNQLDPFITSNASIFEIDDNTFRLKLFHPDMAYLVNKDGMMFSGGMLHQYTDKYFKAAVVDDRRPTSQTYELLKNAVQTDEKAGIYVSEVKTLSNDSSSIGGRTQGVIKYQRCTYDADADYYHDLRAEAKTYTHYSMEYKCWTKDKYASHFYPCWYSKPPPRDFSKPCCEYVRVKGATKTLVIAEMNGRKKRACFIICWGVNKAAAMKLSMSGLLNIKGRTISFNHEAYTSCLQRTLFEQNGTLFASDIRASITGTAEKKYKCFQLRSTSSASGIIGSTVQCTYKGTCNISF